MAEDTVFEAQFTADLGAMAKQTVELRLSGLEAWVVMAQLQLALRHPRNDGPTAAIARAVAWQLQAEVAVTPALEVVAERGWARGGERG